MQYAYWRNKFQKRYKAQAFLAYLQSFSNTYGPLSKLVRVLGALRGLPDLEGLCTGTRPDCLDKAKLAALFSFPGSENWLDLGLQSSCNQTLKRINRGHDAECFARTARLAGDMGLKICAHVIAGLPGEGLDDFLATIEFVNQVPVRGIKIHNLYVCRGSSLALWWQRGDYQPLQMEQYIEWAVQGIGRLRPDIVIHRINGDPRPGELLAPDWALAKTQVLQGIARQLEDLDLWQGKHSGKAPLRPHWFDRDGGLPPGMD